MKKQISYFTKFETFLWCFSVLSIVFSFYRFDCENYLTLLASLIGVTSLIFNAKGNPFGQFLMVLFSMLYGIISFSFAYYGEMITYLGMTMPMALFALFSWMNHPYQENKSEVRVNRITKQESIYMWIFAILITFVFYFILKYYKTANLLPSTLSVTTSFLAVYLTFKRSSSFALAYAANDLVLILLWSFASVENQKYLSVVVCFISFFINDIYGFISWKKMEQRQNR